MSKVITNAFEQYWQSSLAAEQPVVLDEFILADIPNLDITSPIDPDTGLPPQSQIVHRQNVDQRGRINNNAVAYTIVMDTTVGDFSFNAMYLRNKQNGVIGMIVYKGRETKLKTDQTTGQTGNSLVKSMLMGYDQAAEATLTHVDASTWQIDYSYRLRGQDEDLRQLAIQLYGHHTFFGNGFKVVQQDGAYKVTQGVAIVGGLRIELKQPEVIYPGTKPIGVWVDVHRAGSLLSEHKNHSTIITSVADLIDYVDGNGYQHYVAKLATVQADGTVKDRRGNPTTGFIGENFKSVTWSCFAGGADTSGATSAVAALKAAFESGGDIYIPDGEYLIPREGVDTGGCFATIKKSLRVLCSPGARFFTDGLDNTMINIKVPTNGNGLPTNGITCDWEGGFFDQSEQKNSTVIPFITEYPPAKPGQSATCDALTFDGFYTDAGGVVRCGMKRGSIKKVRTWAGDHWQFAGGDSGVGMGGVEHQLIEECFLRGNRDLGIYPTATDAGTVRCSVIVRDNIFHSCFNGASAKRGFDSVVVTGNTFYNCVRGSQSEDLDVKDNENFKVFGNTYIGCQVAGSCKNTKTGYINGNTIHNHGALLADGSSVPNPPPFCFLVMGSTDIEVSNNIATGENPVMVAAWPNWGQGVGLQAGSSGCRILNNTFRNWRKLGNDETNGGKNIWRGNKCPEAPAATRGVYTPPGLIAPMEERVADELNADPWFMSPIYLNVTDETKPLLKGYSGEKVSRAGLFFKGSSEMGVAGTNFLIQGNLRPLTSNTSFVGMGPAPLAGGYTQAAFTVTSDERAKTAPLVITDAMMDAWEEVEWVMFKYLDRVEVKGKDGARWHFGAIAQRAVEAFARHGLDAYHFGFLCYDEWGEMPETLDGETGKVVSPKIEAGSRYGIRYEEALVLEANLQRRKYQRMLKRIEALEAN